MLPIIASIIYLCACLWLIASARPSASESHAHAQHMAGLSTAGLGWLVHGYSLCRAIILDNSLALNSTEVASLISWIIALMTLVKAWNRPRFSVIAALLLLCVGIAAALTNEGARIFSTSQSGWELNAHILIAVLAYALVTVGASLSVAFYILDHRLRHYQPLGWMKSLPSIDALETSIFQSITAGFALLTLTLFSGFFFVRDLFAQHLIHKVALSCVAWLVLGILLWGHWRLGWRGRIAARWILSCFVLLGLSYFGSKFVLEVMLGRHWG